MTKFRGALGCLSAACLFSLACDGGVITETSVGGTLTGVVTTEDGRPVPNVVVSSSGRVHTDSAGAYELPILSINLTGSLEQAVTFRAPAEECLQDTTVVAAVQFGTAEPYPITELDVAMAARSPCP